MTSTKRGFTLVELLVVLAMIGVIMAALTTSVRAAQQRARIQRATSDVKVLSQAILASENYSQGGKFELQAIGGSGPSSGADADASTLKDVLGLGRSADSGGKLPVLIDTALQSGGKMLDPWGTPYKIQIKEGDPNVRISSASGSMCTGYTLPNYYRLSEEERK